MKNMKKATLKIMIPGIITLYIVWSLSILTLTGVVKPSLYAFDADANGTVALYKRHQLTVISEDGSERTFSCECDIPRAISIEGSAIRISMPGSYILFDMDEETEPAEVRTLPAAKQTAGCFCPTSAISSAFRSLQQKLAAPLIPCV